MNLSHPFFAQSNLTDDLCAVINSQHDLVSVNEKFLAERDEAPKSLKDLLSETDYNFFSFQLKETDTKKIHRFQANMVINYQSLNIVWNLFKDHEEILYYISGLKLDKLSNNGDAAKSKLLDTMTLFEEASEIASIGYWDLDLKTQHLMWSKMTRKIHEIPDDYVPDVTNAIAFYEEGEYRDKISELLRQCVEEGLPSTDEFQIITYTGRKKWVIASGIPKYEEGEIVKVYGLFQDITQSKNNEIRLENALEEKTNLFRELHHRVKNNLHMVSSLLFLKSTITESKEMDDFIIETQNRIKSIAKTHDLLLQLQELDELYTKKYLEELIHEIIGSLTLNPNLYPLHINIQDIKLHVDTVLSLGLLTNEIISNIIKHAYSPESGGPITVELSQDDKKCTMIISDVGKGLNANPADHKSIGLLIINQLVESIAGKLSTEDAQGVKYLIEFPITGKS